MLGFPPYYRKTIRNVTAAFGTLFNSLELIREKNGKSQRVKIPLAYSSADKAFSRKTQDPTLNYNMAGVFPRMGFLLTGLAFDPARKISAAQYAAKDNKFVFAPSPYNLEYELYIASANLEDGLQIVEQIIPFFNPEFTVKANFIPEINLNYDIPFILNSVSYTDPAIDSDFTEKRIIEWTLSFTAKVYFSGPTQERNLIKHAEVNVFTDLPFDEESSVVSSKSSVVPEEANRDDPHEIVTETNDSQTITQNTTMNLEPGEFISSGASIEFYMNDEIVLDAEPGEFNIEGRDIL